MFENIHIKAFRGIKDLSLDDFKRVNLLFGKNNCGKSTVLEAMFLLCGFSNPQLPFRINHMRGYGVGKFEDLLLEFYNLQSEKPIVLSSHGKMNRRLEISLEQLDAPVAMVNALSGAASNMNDESYVLRLNFRDFYNEYLSSALISKDSNNELLVKWNDSKEYHESIYCMYRPSTLPFDSTIQGLSKIIENKEINFVVQSMKHISPKIENIQFDDKGNVLVDVGLERMVPINMMGDGTRKILGIISSIYECKDGVVLIDEVDNGFHYSFMPMLWKVILDCAQRNNTQVFATTHNIDSIKGLNMALKGKGKNDCVCYNLVRNNDDSELRAFPYYAEDLDYALTQQIEIR